MNVQSLYYPLEIGNLFSPCDLHICSTDSCLYSNFLLQNTFHVPSLRNNDPKMMAALYLQVSIVSQALIFVTRSRSWSFVERPGILLVVAFILAQLVSTQVFVKTLYSQHIFFSSSNWLTQDLTRISIFFCTI